MATRFKYYSRITTETIVDGGIHYTDSWVGHHKPTTPALLLANETALLNAHNGRLQQGDDSWYLDSKYEGREDAINLRW